jgi:sulfite reductase (NADPH) hemoprotein beta-component
MYVYDAVDQKIVDERVNEYRDQVRRYLAGEFGADEFRQMRLRNGLYAQKHAYMLRVAIPYGLLSTEQLRMLATISRKYDEGYGHFTTRQNIQYNGPKLEQTPDLLADLASVQMHAIQTSGNCVRNITADHLAGVSADEVADPRPWCELMRQFSTFHPEFNWLPRKFKIAFTGRKADGAAIAFHDIGFRMVRNEAGALGFEVHVGGGMGRTPVIGAITKPFLEPEHLFSYTEAILRAYNLAGNRENIFKARIKILLKEWGVEKLTQAIEHEWRTLKGGPSTLQQDEIDRVAAFFAPPPYQRGLPDDVVADDPGFARWLKHNVLPHKAPGYAVVYVSLKARGAVPGDASAEQMEAVATLADAYSFGRVRVTHTQNLLLADVEKRDLKALWLELKAQNLATANIGTLTDIICCPGLDFCSLANASSIPIAKALTERFDDLDYVYDLGDLEVKMSGCINACGHHHAGHIGVLGIDKKGEEWYQILLGGSVDGETPSIGKWIGPALQKQDVVTAFERVLQVFVEQRHEDEKFLDVVRRVGLKPFADKVYVGLTV